jgi:hypothetical protein
VQRLEDNRAGQIAAAILNVNLPAGKQVTAADFFPSLKAVEPTQRKPKSAADARRLAKEKADQMLGKMKAAWGG